MAKDMQFKEYTASVEDSDGDKHESKVRAHVVTDDTKGRVNTPTGGRDVAKGDVLVETDTPGVYDVLNADAWKSTGYGKTQTQQTPKPAGK